jgi:zinc-ribbon domain
MAFCNKCGETLTSDAQFCKKCGAAVTGTQAVPSPAAPTPAGSNGALKVVLIVIAAVVVIGIIAIAAIGFVGYRIAKNAHVTQDGKHTKIETPMGSMESTTDPDQAAHDLGIDIYPGAQVQKDGASSTSIGGMKTVAAKFESSDSLDNVCNFYKSKFPSAMVTTADKNRCAIVSRDGQNMITINAEAAGDKTNIQITSVTKKTSPN